MGWAALLAGVAGFVDAICVLVLGGPFAANMTGNLVTLGMGAAQGKWGQAAWSLAILSSFLAGVLVARLVLRTHRAPRLSLAIVAGVVAVAGAGWLDGAAVPLLAAAMAMQNEAMSHGGSHGGSHGTATVNVAFVTGDIQKLGEQLVAEIVPGGRRLRGERTVLAVLSSYALGAAVGTLGSHWHAAALWLPAAAVAATAIFDRRPRVAAATTAQD